MKKAQYVKHLDISNYTNIAGFNLYQLCANLINKEYSHYSIHQNFIVLFMFR